MRATIAIDGYDQKIEIHELLRGRAVVGERAPLSLTNARIFPAEGMSEKDYADAGEGI